MWRRSWNLRSGRPAALRASSYHERSEFGWMGLITSRVLGNSHASGSGPACWRSRSR